MRKFLISVAACLAIGVFGVVNTSCNDEVIQQIISILIGQQGQTYTYQSSGTVQRLNQTENGYAAGTQQVAFNGAVAVTVTGETAAIAVPNMTVGEVTIENVVFSGLALKASAGGEYTEMYVPDEGVGVEGNATVDGQSCAITNFFIKNARVTSETLSAETLQIFFGDEGQYVVLSLSNITGKTVAQ